MTLYAFNACGRDLDYLQWNWQLIAPDGTVIAQGSTNSALCPIPPRNGRSECVIDDVDDDKRAVALRAWTSVNP